MKGHYRLIPGRVGPSSKPLEQDQKQTSDPQNRCLSHPINQQQRSSFITDPLSFSVFLLRSRPSSELWARHCFFFSFFLHLWLLCACSRLPWWWENGARFVFTRHAQQEQRARRVGRWDRDAQCGVRSSASLCACQNGLLPFWRPSFMEDGEEVRVRPEDCHSLGRRWRGSLRSAVAGRSAVISGDADQLFLWIFL